MSTNYFVTGVSFGIGRELVKRLAANGDRVFGVARTREALEQLQQEVGGQQFCYADFDVGDLTRNPKELLNQIEKKGFFPDAVILNAAINMSDLFPHFDFHVFKEVIETNVYGVVRWVDLFLPAFLQKKRGHFIAVSSFSAYYGSSKGAGYPASKAAISRAFDSFRLRYEKDNVYFTSIHFGPVDTRLWQRKKVPGVLSVDQAVECILKALREKKPSYHSPALVGNLLKFMAAASSYFASRFTEELGKKLIPPLTQKQDVKNVETS